ncbi:MAG: shikimate dehydrogenase [Candidatus Choladocola sp.]|nr:shikimate dehydrogenase [Candidatus Choladocola sp.]
MAKNYRAEIVGVFGDPVEGNPTGVMEEAAFAACGLNYRYLTLKVTKEDFDDAMKSIRALHMKGMNLTMPHKITVLPYLDELSEAARVIGAVNTIVVRDGKLFGENTDGKGFVQALKNKGVGLAGKKVLILGAGGAAKAIAVECALAGAGSITVVNRTAERAAELAQVITDNTAAKASAERWTEQYSIPADTDILINATSIGLSPNSDQKPDIDYDTITDRMVVTDVVFNPASTLFLQEAQKRGAKTVTGLGMLACQGALNFTLWTGVEAPLEIMEETLAKEFE